MISSVSFAKDSKVQYLDNGNKQNSQNKLKFWQYALGSASGYAFKYINLDPIRYNYCIKVLTPYKEMLVEKNGGKEYINKLNSVIDKVFEKSGLKAKGVKIIDFDKLTFEEFIKLRDKHYNINTFDEFQKFTPERKKHYEQIWLNTNMMKKGQDSCCRSGNIWTNKNSPEILTIPHEIGHFLNRDLKTGGIGYYARISKGLKLRQLKSCILLISILKNKKEAGEKPIGIIDKTTTFIKDNCGKLAFLTGVPVIIEEAYASVNGQKLAKEFASEKVMKNLVKHNCANLSSYILRALLLGFEVYMASKISDYVKDCFKRYNQSQHTM